MQNFGINQGYTRITPFKPLQTPGITLPGQESDSPKPFLNPDVFQPAYPKNPDGTPEFPLEQPKWLPPVPSGPIVEVPNNFPMELPPFEKQPEWVEPSPQEIPDWGRFPTELPQPSAPEVNIPKHFPAKTNPDGIWYLS